MGADGVICAVFVRFERLDQPRGAGRARRRHSACFEGMGFGKGMIREGWLPMKGYRLWRGGLMALLLLCSALCPALGLSESMEEALLPLPDPFAYLERVVDGLQAEGLEVLDHQVTADEQGLVSAILVTVEGNASLQLYLNSQGQGSRYVAVARASMEDGAEAVGEQAAQGAAFLRACLVALYPDAASDEIAQVLRTLIEAREVSAENGIRQASILWEGYGLSLMAYTLPLDGRTWATTMLSISGAISQAP